MTELTTDEMILALVERRGFVLPEGVKLPGMGIGASGYNCWSLDGQGGVAFFDRGSKAIHDLCACEFARRVKARSETHSFPSMGLGEAFRHAMYYGDSAAAIRALYDAMEAK